MQPVTLDDGTVIQPEQCLEPAIPSSAFAVIFLPNREYVPSFLKDNKPILDYFRSKNASFQAKLVYHSMSAASVVDQVY